MVVTKSIPYDGGGIRINADINEGGHLIVRVLDEDGKALAKTEKLSADLMNTELQFDREIKNGSISLQFDFVNAKVYSFDLEK